MGLFDRRLKPGDNLSGLATDRLLREYSKNAEAAAYLGYASQVGEFGTKENPAIIDAEAFANSLPATVLKQEIEDELKRRGIVPPA
jgi:hypothetical protein